MGEILAVEIVVFANSVDVDEVAQRESPHLYLHRCLLFFEVLLGVVWTFFHLSVIFSSFSCSLGDCLI